MRRNVIKAHNVSRSCMVCGRENPYSLGASFWELEDGELLATFVPREEHQSYPGRVHGGVSAAILDETIGRAVNILEPEVFGVTVELTTTYRKPVPLGSPLQVVARIERNTSRMFEGTGSLLLEDGTVAVEARGRYVKLPVDKIADGDFSQDWFVDEREIPDSVEL